MPPAIFTHIQNILTIWNQMTRPSVSLLGVFLVVFVVCAVYFLFTTRGCLLRALLVAAVVVAALIYWTKKANEIPAETPKTTAQVSILSPSPSPQDNGCIFRYLFFPD